MTVDFILTGNFSSTTEGVIEGPNLSTITNNIESVSYSDTLTVNSDRWVLDSNSTITVSGINQSPTAGQAIAEYILPLPQQFDFTITLDTLGAGSLNLQFLRIYFDELTNYFDIGVEIDNAEVNYSVYSNQLHTPNSYSQPVGTPLDIRVVKVGAEVYLYFNSNIVASDRFDWLLESELKFKLITEKVSGINPIINWSNLVFEHNIEYTTPAIWRSKPVGDHLTLPPLTPAEYDLISWSQIEVDSVPAHGVLYCQCSTAVTDPTTYVPNIYFPIFTGPLIQFQPAGPVWRADISSLALVAKFLTVRLIMGYSAIPYRDFIQYDQYIYNLAAVPQLDVELDYVPLNSEIVIAEQGLVQSSVVDWERLDSRTIRIKSLVSNEIAANTHIHILYQIPKL